MADSPNNIENNYTLKYVCIQSCGNRSLLKYLMTWQLFTSRIRFYFNNAQPKSKEAQPQAQNASYMTQR